MMVKIKWGGFFLAAILYTILAQIIHTIGAQATMGYYLLEDYFSVWSKIMMPNLGPPGALFFLWSIIFAFVTALLITYVYNVVKKSIAGKTAVTKGLTYGFLLFLVAGIPTLLSMILLINLPMALLFAWTIEGLVIFLLGGMIIARFNK